MVRGSLTTALVMAIAACGGPEAHTAPKPVGAQAVMVAAFPPLETACAADADCTTTGRFSACCGVCEQKYASKAYVEKVTAYCETNPPAQCPPMGCSWGMAEVHCVTGQCRAAP